MVSVMYVLVGWVEQILQIHLIIIQKLYFIQLTWVHAHQRAYCRGVAPADCWNWGKWGQGFHMKVVLLWYVRWVFLAGTRDFYSARSALVGPVKHIFSLTVLYFNSFVPITQQSGHEVVMGRLSLNMCPFSFVQYSYHQCGYLVIVQFYTVARKTNYISIHSCFLTKIR